jgi:hypothetical protein
MTIHAFAHSLCISHVAAELGHMTDRHQFVHFEWLRLSWVI